MNLKIVWWVPAALAGLLLTTGALWFYDSGKRAAERAEFQAKIKGDESTIVALRADSAAAQKKSRADSMAHAADSGNYAGLEKRLRAAEAQYAAHLAQDSTDNTNDAQAPDTGSHGVVAKTPAQPPSPGLIDSTLDAADAAQKSCSVLVLDCKAQNAILRQELAATQDERDAWKRQAPTFLMRNEGAVCTASGVVGFVSGIVLGRRF